MLVPLYHIVLYFHASKEITKDPPPPYQENATNQFEDVQGTSQSQVTDNTPMCEVLDLLANCKITSESDENLHSDDYVEIEEMGLWHSSPLQHRHKSKISLTWVLKDNLENVKVKQDDIIKNKLGYLGKNCNQLNENERLVTKYKGQVNRVVGRNESYHNLKFRNACEEFNGQESYSDSSVGTEEYVRRKHRHRHRRKKRQNGKFGYDIRDLDSFLSAASIDHPGNIPVVIAFPTILYQTQKDCQQELTLPLGTVVNAVFKNQQWVYAQTPHGHEGYLLYTACLPLGILPNRTSVQKKTPCWESSTDIYPRPCGNLTDTEKEQLRGRTRSETRSRPRVDRSIKSQTSCAEKDFDTLYLKTKSICSNIDKLHDKENVQIKSVVRRQTLLVVNSDYGGNALNKTLSVNKGDVVMLMQGVGESDVDSEWFYVKKKDGSQGFIPAVVAGHGYI
ncbi:uncharacterized protein LOC106720674 isoform X1 [Papilio machaon]|uniref:uncharacterized protein LOC106720674 isoform X1 n=1 Tax=Papilio machaon TaxID=76193 RepID=UPI001E665022|nr:uncharacterized protein LOC106720674 isoform X1 [Papilio machaon]